MRSLCLICVTIASFLISLSTGAATPISDVISNTAPASNNKAADLKVPVIFEENIGQADAQVKFLSRRNGNTLFLTPTEAVFSFRTPNLRREAEVLDTEQQDESDEIHAAVLRMQLVGANPEADIVGAEALPGKINYLIGNNRDNWHTNVPHYAKLQYRNVYPGIDMVFYGNGNQLEYDFVVAPGANISHIMQQFVGADRLTIDVDGDLLVEVADHKVIFEKPLIYQEIDGERRTINGQFVVGDNHTLKFQVATYDVDIALVIDPQLVFSTYLGGSGSDGGGRSIAVDPDGNVYAAGATRSVDFPTTAGVFQPGSGGGTDGFITKFDANGMVVYSTYLGSGGGSADDALLGLAVDTGGFAYVVGQTGSPTFPTTLGAFDRVLGGPIDAFVAKLNQDGTALVYSTYLGGSNDNDSAIAIAVDESGSAYVTGQTRSDDFPSTLGAFDKTCGTVAEPCSTTRQTDAFVTKLTANGSALVYSTFLGGRILDTGRDIALDASGNAYVTGDTQSTDFPTTPNAFQTVRVNSFVTELNADGSGLIYSTFLGNGQTASIALDASGKIYIQGHARNWPITSGAFQEVNAGGQDVVLSILDPSQSFPADQLVYSTFVGGSGFDFGVGLGLDAAGKVYISGWTNSTDFPIKDAIQATLTSKTACSQRFDIPPCSDVFVAKLNPGGNGLADLVYSTYLGGSDSERNGNRTNRLAIDAAGNAYVTEATFSDDFPTVNAAQSVLGGVADALVAKIGEPFISVDIDIKPGSDPNSINLGSSGVIPVAVFSAADFDAPAEIDPNTISLAGARVKMVGKSNKFLCHSEDVNADALADLVCKVETAQFMIETGESVAVLEADTFGGTPVRGEDNIKIVP